MTNRRTGVPALYRWQRRAWLRIALLAHFDEDAAFRADLQSLALPGGSSDLRIADVAARFHLDRLLTVDDLPSGPELLRQWVMFAQHDGGQHGLASAAGFGGAVAEVGVEAAIRWDPTRESRPAAKRRLTAEVDALLARGEAEAVANDYEMADTAPRVTDHIRWTYLHLRGQSFREIAKAEGDKTGHRGIAIAVRRMENEIGLGEPLVAR